MSKNFLAIVLVLTLAGFFVAKKTNAFKDEPKNRYERILRNVGILLQEGHYSPKKMDDAFSKQVLNNFLKSLDSDRNIFLASDIKSFEKFNSQIDDEIKGAQLKSFYEINETYIKRQKEVFEFYQGFLKKPFNFQVNETVQLDRDSVAYPTTDAERKELWRKQIKYMVLDKYVSLQEEQQRKKNDKDFKAKADSTLEREARESIDKVLNRMFTTKINHDNDDENFSSFVNAVTTTMDPHTTYFPPIDLRSFNESMRGSFFGIGAQLKDEDGKIKIAVLQTGMPAQKSGQLLEGDEILKVGEGDKEPVDVTGYSVTDAVKLIRGEDGTIVKLTVRKLDGSVKVISLKRAKIDLDMVFARSAVIKNDGNKIGYIYLPEFYADFEDPNGRFSYKDVAEEVEKLKRESVDGIMIDLRGNGGGSLNDVVQMVGLFIPEGPVVQVRTRGNQTNVLKDRDSRVQYDGPLAVLIDETSASASEIFAAAIQDYGRGIVIGGTSSYGKGTVQRNIPLNPSENLFSKATNSDDLGTIKLTLQKFYRIDGGSTQQKGVVPDVVVPSRLEYVKFREKDVPNSLSWDKINNASYSNWKSSYSRPEIINYANQIVAKDSAFSRIQNKVKWVSDNTGKAVSLNINDFKERKQEMNTIYKDLDTLFKLKTPMTMVALSSDSADFKGNTEKENKFNDFVNFRKNDIYLNNAARIMDVMIKPSTIANALKQEN